MEYRKHKDLRLSKIGVGSYSLSGAYGKKDIEKFKNMIKRAYDLGINFFDTADAYGDAEKILGKVVEPFREEIVISTKVGVKNNIKSNLSYNHIKLACENSLKNLKTEYIDIYNVHFDDSYTPVEETIEALEELVKEGKIRKYGLGYLPEEKEKWLKKEQKNTINKILYGDLSEDKYKAFVDLIYSIETAITNKYVKEDKIMSEFHKLYGMRNKLDEVKNYELKEIQKQIRNMLKFT